MPLIKRLFCLLLFFSLALPALARTPLPADPELLIGQLDNGVTYAILPNREPQDRVSLRLLIRAGSLQEQDHERGLAHYLEHMAFRGTENFAAGTLVEYFQNLGMAFGADTNAYTAFDRTVYMIELPEPGLDKIDEGLLVLRDYAGRMLIEEAEVEAEKGVILAEKRDRDSVRFRTALEEFAFLLPGAIISERFPIGVEETIRAADAERLRTFFDHWYRPGKTALIVVGEVNPEEVRELIARHFNDFTERAPAPPVPDLGTVRGEPLQATLHPESEAANVRVSIQTVAPYSPRPDTLENRIDNLTRSVAMRILQRRLDEKARQEDAAFSRGAAASYDLFNFFTNTSIELMTRSDRWEEALETAEKAVRRFREHGLHELELEEMKLEVERGYRELAERANTRNSRTLAEQLVRSITYGNTFTHPAAEYEWMREALARMTVADVEEAFARAWDGVGIFLFLTGDLSPEIVTEEAIKDVYHRSLAQPVMPHPERERPEFAYSSFGEPGEIVEREVDEELDLTLLRFANHVRLNYKQTDFAEGTVLLRVRLGHGRLTEPEDRQGLGILAEQVLIEGALEAHSRDELRRIFAGYNVGWGFRAEEDAFVFGGSTSPSDLLRQLQLLAAYLTAPGYRPEALRLARENMPEIYNQATRTNRGVLANEVSRFLAGGDHRFGLPPEDVLRAYTMEDVADLLNPVLSSAYLELSVVGDFAPEELERAVAATLGALPPREVDLEPREDLRQLQPAEGPLRKVFPFPSRLPGGRTLVYWPIPDRREIERVRRFAILASIFSDRMRLSIREALGEAYSPFATPNPSNTFRDFGWFIALVGTEEGNAEVVADLILDIARDLHTEGASEDELTRALRPMLNSLRDARRDNSYWMNSVLDGVQANPEQRAWSRSMLEDFASITREDVNHLARTFLNPDEALIISILPRPPEE